MPFYIRRGQVPRKRHTQFRRPDGTLYAEEVFGTHGFSGVQSILYRLRPPTRIARVLSHVERRPHRAEGMDLRPRHFQGDRVEARGDFLQARVPLLVNSDVRIALARPAAIETDFFFKHVDGDELIFVHRGKGTLETMLGPLDFRPGDYLVIPRGIVYRMQFEDDDNLLFILESSGAIEVPPRYRNSSGQFLEHAPFCERDLRPPAKLETIDEEGEFEVRIHKGDQLYRIIYPHHPFDVVGWDGHCYPYAFSIHDFEPITGRIHQPPPVHQTFRGPNFVVCSFVPRLFDYHPEAIPAPYNHSNIDSDEVLYYAAGNFMSRRGIREGSITLHPAGIPHGPHPGTVEASIGKKETKELAVMVDTFRPLHPTVDAAALADPAYAFSWLT